MVMSDPLSINRINSIPKSPWLHWILVIWGSVYQVSSIGPGRMSMVVWSVTSWLPPDSLACTNIPAPSETPRNRYHGAVNERAHLIRWESWLEHTEIAKDLYDQTTIVKTLPRLHHKLNLKWLKNAEKHLLRQNFSMSPLPMYSKAQQLSSVQDTGEWLPVWLKRKQHWCHWMSSRVNGARVHLQWKCWSYMNTTMY